MRRKQNQKSCFDVHETSTKAVGLRSLEFNIQVRTRNINLRFVNVKMEFKIKAADEMA